MGPHEAIVAIYFLLLDRVQPFSLRIAIGEPLHRLRQMKAQLYSFRSGECPPSAVSCNDVQDDPDQTIPQICLPQHLWNRKGRRNRVRPV